MSNPCRTNQVMSNQHTTYMTKEVLYLGLDVHAENIAVAIAEAGRDGEVRSYGEIPNTFHSVEKLMRKLGHPDKELRVCYEAGPCGFVLARFLKKKGIACDVIAPSLTPKGSGDKIKTDRRDARMLARLHRAGEPSAGGRREIDSRQAAPQG